MASLVSNFAAGITFSFETPRTKASSIQESLATALERAIASASVLLREALVGRIRACEAEKQVTFCACAAPYNEGSRSTAVVAPAKRTWVGGQREATNRYDSHRLTAIKIGMAALSGMQP